MDNSQSKYKLRSELRHFLYLMSVRYLKITNASEVKIKRMIKNHCKYFNRDEASKEIVF